MFFMESNKEIGGIWFVEKPKLKKIFESLHQYYTDHFPAPKNKLFPEIKKILEKDDPEVNPEKIVEELIDIGVVYDYQPKKKGSFPRYHIPDLYLFGMRLKRKGPGAHKLMLKN